MKVIFFVLFFVFLLPLTLHHSFGDLTGISAFYSDLEPVNVIEKGEKSTYKVTLRGEGSFAFVGKADFFIGKVSDKSPTQIGGFDFDVDAGSFETFGVDYTPDQTGRFLLTMTMNEHGSGGLFEEETTQTFYVVDEYSKIYDLNGGCAKDEHKPVVKLDYGSVVCVTDSTKNTLVERGWHFG